MKRTAKRTAQFLGLAIPGVVGLSLWIAAQALSRQSKETMSEYYEAQLAWVEGADPLLMLEDDLRAGHPRFFSVCGYSCNIVGLGDLNYERCYSASATVQAIEGTTDAIYSKRHGELCRKATTFATEYNQLLAKRLDTSGKRICPVGEDWDSLFYSLSAHVAQLTPSPPLAWVALSTKPSEDGYNFRIHLPNASAQSRSAQAAICAIVVENGVRREVAFLTTFGDAKGPTGTVRFSCRAGEG